MRPAALAPAALVVVVAGVYLNGLGAPFLFDDFDSVVENPYVRSLLPLARALSAPPQSAVAGRPLAALSLAANHALGGLDPRGYRAFNLAVHAACALALFGVVRRTLDRERLHGRFEATATACAGSVALLWAVHPLTSETVNYITQRTESMMAACYLFTLYASIRAWDALRARRWEALAVAACALGMTAKETMVTAPLAVVLHDLCHGAPAWRETLRRRRRLYAGLAAGWIVLALLMRSGPRSETVGFTLGVSALDYLKGQCLVVPDYLWHVLWPHPLVADYGYARPVATGQAILPALLLGALAASAAWALLRRPSAGFPAAAFFLVLAPTSSVVPIVSEVGAERRMYLPLAAAMALAVLAGQRALEPVRRRDPRRAGWLAAAAVLLVAAALAAVTHARNRDYLDETALWRSAVRARPANPRAHNNLGRAVHVRGDAAGARRHYARAIELDDAYADAHYNMGVALADLGLREDAIESYRRALERNPRLHRAHHNLGSELAQRGDLDAALPHFREAVRLAPHVAHARHSLARALRLSGDAANAVPHYREAIRLEPRMAAPRGDLAWLLATHPDARLRDPQEAVALAQEAVRLAGRDDPTLLDALAAAQASAGRFAEALATAERALLAARGPAYERLAAEIRARRDGYRRGEPHREP
jgi:tetratricopeptide (TPR) repeat protein